MQDAELLELMQTNPEKGCEALLREYTPTVLAICRRKLSGAASAEDIEELAADILFGFWQKRDAFSPEKGSVRALLSIAAERRCIDFYRAWTAKTHLRTQPLDDLAAPPEDPAPSPEDAVLSAEQRKILLDAVYALGEPDTEIILRKYYYGETAAQIAQRLSMRTGTVEMRLSRARKKLAHMLGGADYEP